MRYLLRLAGLAIILWLHHPLLASPATASSATPLRERDRIAVRVIFSYGDSHTKTLQNGSTIRFESERSGSFDAMLDRYRAYHGVDSFKLETEGSETSASATA